MQIVMTLQFTEKNLAMICNISVVSISRSTVPQIDQFMNIVVLKAVNYGFQICCNYVPDVETARELLNKRVAGQGINEFYKGEEKLRTLK